MLLAVIFFLGFLLWPAAALVLGLVFSSDKVGVPQLMLFVIVVLVFISFFIN